MKQQINKTLIGGFVVAALALAFAGVMVFGSGKLFKETNRYVLYFQESVKGLSVGAPVLFKGVKIGSVTDVLLIANTEDLSLEIPVYIEVIEESIRLRGKLRERNEKKNMGLLIARGLRAQLQSQSMVTGQLMIALAFHPDQPANLVGAEPGFIEIPTIPSTMENLMQTIKNLHLETLTQNLSDAVAGLEDLINSPEITASIQELHKAIQDIRTLIQNTDRRIGPIADGIDATIEDSRKLVRNVDTQVVAVGTGARKLIGNTDAQVGPLAENMNRTLDDARKLMGDVNAQVDPLSESMRRTADAARTAFEHARTTLKSVEGTLGKDSPVMHQVTRTLKDLSGAARSIRVWAEYLERHPEALVQGKK